jgi:hypothetical protein
MGRYLPELGLLAVTRGRLTTPERRKVAAAISVSLAKVAMPSELAEYSVFPSHQIGRLRLAESLELWTLGVTALSELRQGFRRVLQHHRLIEFAENTCLWHHQIRGHKKHAIGFAQATFRPAKAGNGEWTIERIGASPLARRLDAALHAADRRGATHPLRKARLLTMPSLHVSALWLEERSEDHLIVVDNSSRRFQITARRVEEWHDFFGILARGLEREAISNKTDRAAQRVAELPASIRTSPPVTAPAAGRAG